jgi:hypothetical protein
MHALMLLVILAPAQEGSAKPPPRAREEITDAVLDWNRLALDAIREARTAPPLAARNLAILHTALFDTVNTIDPEYQPFRVALRATENIHTAAAVAACGQRVLSELYPAQARTFDLALQLTLSEIPAGRARTLGVGLGRHVADRILAWRRDDGHDRPATYRATLDVGVWRPTPPGYAAALLPRYGETPLFGVRDRKAIRFAPPPELAGKELAKDLQEVKWLGGRDSVVRTAEESIIAWFWEGGSGTCTPPGHWNQIAREVAGNKGLSLRENARLFALLNLALADAAIFCWECKYRYRLWRPVTAIRLSETAPVRDWAPLLDTPPFPSYTSGHSTFSGAGAAILAKFFNSDGVEFTVGSDGFPGAERSFKGFWEAAREAGRSRIFGGIHYECDHREGLALGKAIAEEIFRTRLLPPEDATRPSGADRPRTPGLRRAEPKEGTPPRPLPKGPDSNTASSRRERP